MPPPPIPVAQVRSSDTNNGRETVSIHWLTIWKHRAVPKAETWGVSYIISTDEKWRETNVCTQLNFSLHTIPHPSA